MGCWEGVGEGRGGPGEGEQNLSPLWRLGAAAPPPWRLSWLICMGVKIIKMSGPGIQSGPDHTRTVLSLHPSSFYLPPSAARPALPSQTSGKNHAHSSLTFFSFLCPHFLCPALPKVISDAHMAEWTLADKYLYRTSCPPGAVPTVVSPHLAGRSEVWGPGRQPGTGGPGSKNRLQGSPTDQVRLTKSKAERRAAAE